NPDTLLLNGGLASAARFLGDCADVGVLGVRIENPDGGIQASCRAFPSHRTALFNRHSLTTKLIPGNRWSKHYLMSDWSHDEPRDVDWVSGACMLIHRRAIDAVGLLDSEYFFSIEDVDYARRVHTAGLRVVYYPMASVQHRVGGSSRHAVYRAMTAHHLGMWHYYRRHMATTRVLDAATAAGIAGRLAIHITSYTLRTARNRALRRPNP
ncbi:MAG: glycosyltransferase, partial [Anaerolineaceae bacterium]